MKIVVEPLYSKLNELKGCPLGCQNQCRVAAYFNSTICPLSSHQAQTAAYSISGQYDVIFNTAATGDGKTLGAFLPSLLNPSFRIMGLYPTIELVEDQTRQQKVYHDRFGLNWINRVDFLYGSELSRRVKEFETNRFQELLISLETKPIILTNPDIFHFISHFRYRDPAYGLDLLPLYLAKFPDLWVFDEFHIFGVHQDSAVLNSLSFIKRSQHRTRTFLFTSATPKPEWIEQLSQIGFTSVEVEGVYSNQPEIGFRPILQEIVLNIVDLQQSDPLGWLTENLSVIRKSLMTEVKGRGLIILNSVALVGRVVRVLSELLPEVVVQEISGRIPRLERIKTQETLAQSESSVLIVGTSAVDVGVDFKIHLLIIESNNAPTIIQRLGRLGRHQGFSRYEAFILISGRIPWAVPRLKEQLGINESISRAVLQQAIAYSFEPQQVFREYRQKWGVLQVQGILSNMTMENSSVLESVRSQMKTDLTQIYGDKLESASKWWYALGRDQVGKAIQAELLRFRGGSTLQAGIWDGSRFYIYDLLRLLPYARVLVISQEEFVNAALQHGYFDYDFPTDLLTCFLKIEKWVDDRFELELECDRSSQELKTGELDLVTKIAIVGHPQSEVTKLFYKRKLLSFLIPVKRSDPYSHWEVSRILHLNSLFGLYRIKDAANQAYAIAFNQDALLLEALKFRLRKFFHHSQVNLIF